MPPRRNDDVFPVGRKEGAPSYDIGWHFAIPVEGNQNNVQCKFCQEIIRGGITRLKEHIAHMKGTICGCARVQSNVRESMMKFLQDSKAKKLDTRKRRQEFEERLRDDDEDEDMDDIDQQVRIAAQDSYRSQREWQDRQEFRQQTGRNENVYEPGEGSRANVSGVDLEFSLRSTNVDLARSQSMKQPKVNGSFLKTARKKLGSAVSKFLIYERLPMNLSKSPWLHNLIVAAAELGKEVKFPTPYEVSDVYLDIKYNKGWSG